MEWKIGMFVMFVAGYWMGRDMNKNPKLFENVPAIVYAWAFVGVFSAVLSN